MLSLGEGEGVELSGWWREAELEGRGSGNGGRVGKAGREGVIRVEVSPQFNARLYKISDECGKFLKISGECGKISLNYITHAVNAVKNNYRW